MWSDLTLDPFFKVKPGKPNLKVLITRLLLVLKFWVVKLTYRKSWAGSLLMWSDLTLGPSLFSYSQKSFSISYKIANCRDTLFLNIKTFCLVSYSSPYITVIREICLKYGR